MESYLNFIFGNSNPVNPSNPRNPGLVFVLVGAAVFLFPTIFWPFDYDQGTFAYGGWAVLHGAKPYIDFWDIKPPNIFYTYASAFAVFGNTVRAVRVLDYLNALLTIALLYACAMRFWKHTSWNYIAAVASSMVFILQYYIFGHWNTAQTETYSVPLLLGSVLLVLSRGNNVRSFVAGILVGLSFYFKFPNALFLLVPILIAATRTNALRSDRIKFATIIGCGFIATVGLETLYLQLEGEFIPLWNLTMSETTSYLSSNYSGSFTIWNNLRTSMQALDPLWVFVGAVGWIVAFERNRRTGVQKGITKSMVHAFILLTMACGIGVAVVQLGRKGYTYHYAVLLPWADLLIGAGVAQLARTFSFGRRISHAAFAIILLIILSIASYCWTSSRVLHSRLSEFTQIVKGTAQPNGYIVGDTLSDYVIQHTKPSDRIFIFGFQPYVYWKSGRAPAVKFINTIHFKPKNVNIAQRGEFVHTLLCNPPALFIVETTDRYTSQGNTNDDSRTTIRLQYPELEQLLLDRYSPVDTIQSAIIYQRR